MPGMMDNLEHDSNEDALLIPPGVDLPTEMAGTATPIGATGFRAPEPPPPGPIQQQRAEMRQRAGRSEEDEWLHPDNPAIWEGDAGDADDDAEYL